MVWLVRQNVGMVTDDEHGYFYLLVWSQTMKMDMSIFGVVTDDESGHFHFVAFRRDASDPDH